MVFRCCWTAHAVQIQPKPPRQDQDSLVETCKANRVDIYRYLTDLFKALPYATTADDYEALLPWKLGTPAYEKNG